MPFKCLPVKGFKHIFQLLSLTLMRHGGRKRNRILKTIPHNLFRNLKIIISPSFETFTI